MSWKNRKLHDFTYKGTCQSTHHCFHHIAPDTSLFQCVANLPSRGIPVHIRSVDSDETSKHILLIPIFLKVGSTQYTCITITVLGYDKHGSFINRKEWTHLIFLSTCPRNRLNCLSSCALKGSRCPRGGVNWANSKFSCNNQILRIAQLTPCA